MYHDSGTTVVNKRMSFLSVTVLSLSAVLIATIVSASGIAIYGMRVIDRKCDSLTMLVGDTVRQLPEFRKSLPPALADAIDDVRRPDYLDNLEVTTSLGHVTESRRGRIIHATVEVTNNGDEVVSLLSMRLVGVDEDGAPIMEHNTWAATPIQVEDEWRGPLLPHETRRIPVRFFANDDIKTISHEITDIRVWKGAAQTEQVASRTLP
ncbi:MAG: hypothetical protein IPK83_06000 [Planctomycetes bacterium]|nr:hypothetical protein [Planctomycetota bacterium]